MQIINEHMRRALQAYTCDAAQFLSDFSEKDMSPEHWSIVQKHRANGFRINKGDDYFCQVVRVDGQIMNTRCIPEILGICIEYGAHLE